MKHILMNMTTKTSVYLAIFLYSIIPSTLWAEAPVEDAVPTSSNTYSSSSYSSAPTETDPEVPLSQDNSASMNNYSTSSNTFNPNNPASLLSKINEMQREIQRLRGQMEIQSHELTKLKEQQQAYYNDLDQRITMLSSHGKTKTQTLSLDDTTKATSTNKTAASGDEESSYNAAYALIENKQFSQAKSAMESFLQQYPHGKYASNAHYWLGELLLAQHQDQAAIKEFDTVINKYPSSSKVSAAMLKLGFAYANVGDTGKAKAAFMKVEKTFPNTTTAQIAHARLETLP